MSCWLSKCSNNHRSQHSLLRRREGYLHYSRKGISLCSDDLRGWLRLDRIGSTDALLLDDPDVGMDFGVATPPSFLPRDRSRSNLAVEFARIRTSGEGARAEPDVRIGFCGVLRPIAREASGERSVQEFQRALAVEEVRIELTAKIKKAFQTGAFASAVVRGCHPQNSPRFL
jgi:hypothetical protein